MFKVFTTLLVAAAAIQTAAPVAQPMPNMAEADVNRGGWGSNYGGYCKAKCHYGTQYGGNSNYCLKNYLKKCKEDLKDDIEDLEHRVETLENPVDEP